jgi:hypothetical protein
MIWFIISPPGTPIHQKLNFHYNKQQWTTQHLASAPIVCTAMRTSEATATTRRHSGTDIHGPANQQHQEGGAEAGGGESGAPATADNKQQQFTHINKQ